MILDYRLLMINSYIYYINLWLLGTLQEYHSHRVRRRVMIYIMQNMDGMWGVIYIAAKHIHQCIHICIAPSTLNHNRLHQVYTKCRNANTLQCIDDTNLCLIYIWWCIRIGMYYSRRLAWRICICWHSQR